jgi:hypothetical protein
VLEPHYNEIKNAARGVPKHKVETIRNILVKRYGVKDAFLNTNKGPILSYYLPKELPIHTVNEDAVKYIANNEIEKLQLKLKYLHAQLEEKEKIILLQQEVIDNYRKNLEV